MRKIARTDANHTAIIKALREVGAHVCSLAQVGGGCPDILVSYRGTWHAVEIKDGNAPPSKRQLTPAQIKWHTEARAIVHVVHNVEQALEAIGAGRSIGLEIV